MQGTDWSHPETSGPRHYLQEFFNHWSFNKTLSGRVCSSGRKSDPSTDHSGMEDLYLTDQKIKKELRYVHGFIRRAAGYTLFEGVKARVLVKFHKPNIKQNIPQIQNPLRLQLTLLFDYITIKRFNKLCVNNWHFPVSFPKEEKTLW